MIGLQVCLSMHILSISIFQPTSSYMQENVKDTTLSEGDGVKWTHNKEVENKCVNQTCALKV